MIIDSNDCNKKFLKHNTDDPDSISLEAAYNNAIKSCKRAYIRADAQRVARVSQELLAHSIHYTYFAMINYINWLGQQYFYICY